MRVLKADKRRDILYLLIDGLWVSAKAAGFGIFKRCLDVIVSLTLLIIAAPASALRLLSARSLIVMQIPSIESKGGRRFLPLPEGRGSSPRLAE